MTVHDRLPLTRILYDRWATVIREDIQTQGFWDDVARAFGRDDSGDLTKAERASAQACVDYVVRFMEASSRACTNITGLLKP